MLPITPLSLRLSCQGLSSPPTCRHWTAIAAPKQIPPAQTPPQHPNHQRKTSPHPEKKKIHLPLLANNPHRLASPRLSPPPMSVLDLTSQQPAARTPSRLFSLVFPRFHTYYATARVSTRPSRPSFCDTKPFVPHFPGQCSAALYTCAAEDSGPCRVWVSRLAELQGCVII